MVGTAAVSADPLLNFVSTQPLEMPRYARLRFGLLAAIDAGLWKPGAKLPTEREIADITGMSLGTVQKALGTLEQDGVLRRLHGRGTFVREGGAELEHNWHCRYLNDDESAFLPVYVRDVAREPASGNGEWKQHFPGDARVVCIDRILDVNGEFSAFSRFYFDAGRFPRMAARPLPEMSGKNLKELLAAEKPVAVIEKRQTLTLAPVPSYAIRAMNAKRGITIGTLQIIGRTAGNETLYFYQLLLPPTPRKLVITSL